MKFPSLFEATAAVPWPWSACVNSPRTLSFLVYGNKTMNSAYLDDKSTVDSLFSIRDSDDECLTGCSSSLEEAKPHKESVNIMAMDFRASMEEMVEAHRLKDWDCLEELLTCHLKVNSKSNHCYIVGAFGDLMINLALDCSTSAVDEHFSSSATTH